jgi:hypothetical protein
MYLVSLSQPHNATSVPELSRSHEFEHEVRREVTLLVMRWFGQVYDVDERWKMNVEEAVRQVSLGILFCVGTRFVSNVFSSFILALIPHLIPTLFLVLTVLAE